jgi:hypothetical protein
MAGRHLEHEIIAAELRRALVTPQGRSLQKPGDILPGAARFLSLDSSAQSGQHHLRSAYLESAFRAGFADPLNGPSVFASSPCIND